MASLEEHVEELKRANEMMRSNCPWLSDRKTDGSFHQYGDCGALCNPSEKVAAGRAASAAYEVVRHLEFEHLSDTRERLREELSRRRDMAEEASRLLIKDLFEKCEEITSCISCSCASAVSAHHNLERLLHILSNEST